MCLIYPKRQINGEVIIQPLEHVSVYLTNIGDYQSKGYNEVVKHLMQSPDSSKIDKIDGLGYSVIANPLEALNMIYPNGYPN